LKVTLVLMCLVSHFDIIGSWKLNVGHRVIYYAKKILNSFVCLEVRILVEKWNMYEDHIFTRPLLQTFRLETTSLCLNTRLHVNKNFKIHIILIEINVNVCLMCSSRSDKYNPSYSKTYLSIKDCYALGFYVSANFLFSHFEELKSTFFTSQHFVQRGVY